jgi:hypothetical protein
MTANPGQEDQLKDGGQTAAPLVVPYDRLLLAAVFIGRGYSVEEVSQRVNVSSAQLRHVLNFYRIKGRAVGKGARRVEPVVASASWAVLERAAALRGIEPVDLVERLIDVLCMEPKIMQNLLDDGCEVQ